MRVFVTGATGFIGIPVARELIAAGHEVRTLTGHPGHAPAGSLIEARPLDFADADGLERHLRGAHTLYNTYWVRFPTAARPTPPPAPSTAAIMLVVVVLPCIPATAMPYFSRINSASISARWITGIFRVRASTTSAFVAETAELVTTTSTAAAFSAA